MRGGAAALALALMAAGCSTTPKPNMSEARPKVERMTPREGAVEPWAKVSKGLGETVGEALANSPKIAAAKARTEQARARAGAARAALAPVLSAAANFSESGDEKAGTRQSSETTGLSLSWSPDVFGTRSAELGAREAELAAQEAETLATERDAAADAADGYLSLLSCARQEARMKEDEKSRERTLAIEASREEAGLSSSSETARALTMLSEARSALAGKSAECSIWRARVAEITGEDSSAIERRVSVDSLPDRSLFESELVDANAIRSKPEVAAAEASTIAAWREAQAADRARYPSLSLSGTLGSGIVSANGVSRLASPWTFALAGSQALLDFGAARSRSEAARARMEEAFAVFVQRVAEAARAAEEALATQAEKRERLRLAGAAAEASRILERNTRERLNAGLAGEIEAEESYRTRSAAERAEDEAKLAFLKAQTATFRVLGVSASTKNREENKEGDSR